MGISSIHITVNAAEVLADIDSTQAEAAAWRELEEYMSETPNASGAEVAEAVYQLIDNMNPTPKGNP